LAASHRQIKKSLLCVLRGFAVKILFRTRVMADTEVEHVSFFMEEEVDPCLFGS
jgi:hypothetical protein